MTLFRYENATFYGLFVSVTMTLGVYLAYMLQYGSH